MRGGGQRWPLRAVAGRGGEAAGSRRRLVGASGALRVEFADEEDYVKDGGGELLYVQMWRTAACSS